MSWTINRRQIGNLILLFIALIRNVYEKVDICLNRLLVIWIQASAFVGFVDTDCQVRPYLGTSFKRGILKCATMKNVMILFCNVNVVLGWIRTIKFSLFEWAGKLGGVSKLPLTFVLCVECHQHIDLEEGNIIKIHKHDRQLRMLPIRLVRVPSWCVCQLMHKPSSLLRWNFARYLVWCYFWSLDWSS